MMATSKTTTKKITTTKKTTTTKSTTSAKKTTAPKAVVTEETSVQVNAKKKILFVASEATPFIVTGGLAEVIGSLSKALAATGRFDVRVVIPLYSDIKKEYRDQFTYLGNLYVPLAWRNQYCGIFTYEKDGVIFYFLDNEFYFKRPGCYGYFDDGERFAFFSRAVLEIMPFLNFYPEVMHCHDWQSALAAIYLKTNYCFRPEYQYIRALFTIHNIEYQGQYSLDILSSLFDIYGSYRYLVEYNNSINLMKGAIECCEKFSTVSPRYAQEIKDPYYAHGLDPIIRKNEFKLVGILNGIDDQGYNSALDKQLFANYTPEDMSNKAVCKAELQKMLNLPVKPNTPIIAMISRLVSHKGLDLVTNVIEELLQDDVQVVILGTGDSHYEGFFADLARRYPDKMSANIVFNNALSRKIYSGADIFLMPSKSEPCGLSQMIACRYATIPIVRETGGLYDSIKPLQNGYTFANYNAHDMLYVIRQAISDYKNKEEWAKLMYRAITTDFSWSHSAKDYEALYLDMLK
jgi:starch synthase